MATYAAGGSDVAVTPSTASTGTGTAPTMATRGAAAMTTENVEAAVACKSPSRSCMSGRSSAGAAAAAATSGKSRWRKLLSSLRKTKVSADAEAGGDQVASGGGGGGKGAGGVAAYRLKHSHNCSNSELRAGISNMKGYKKANQDR